ncbi:MAG: response regulator [Pseudomonadota bacterium]
MSRKPAVILVVDDSPVYRVLLQALVERLGFPAIGAGDGREALEIVERHRPALVLMDVCMPVMDGVEAARRIRARLHCTPPPIVAITSLDAADVDRLGGHGMFEAVLPKIRDLDTARAIIHDHARYRDTG